MSIAFITLFYAVRSLFHSFCSTECLPYSVSISIKMYCDTCFYVRYAIVGVHRMQHRYMCVCIGSDLCCVLGVYSWNFQLFIRQNSITHFRCNVRSRFFFTYTQIHSQTQKFISLNHLNWLVAIGLRQVSFFFSVTLINCHLLKSQLKRRRATANKKKKHEHKCVSDA